MWNTLSRLRSGGEHFDPELGPAGNTLILSLRWMSDGEHCDLELAVEVRKRKRKEE